MRYRPNWWLNRYNQWYLAGQIAERVGAAQAEKDKRVDRAWADYLKRVDRAWADLQKIRKELGDD